MKTIHQLTNHDRAGGTFYQGYSSRVSQHSQILLYKEKVTERRQNIPTKPEALFIRLRAYYLDAHKGMGRANGYGL